jgi:hypothetical protein
MTTQEESTAGEGRGETPSVHSCRSHVSDKAETTSRSHQPATGAPISERSTHEVELAEKSNSAELGQRSNRAQQADSQAKQGTYRVTG